MVFMGLDGCAYIILRGEGSLAGYGDAVTALSKCDASDSRVCLGYKQGAAAVEYKSSCTSHAIGDELSSPTLG